MPHGRAPWEHERMMELLNWAKGIGSLLIIISILVIAHEYGHYAAAKWFKMRVEDFSLFFGRVLWRIGKWGDTVYNIRAVPLGGFVKIAGMEAEDISSGRPVLAAIKSPPAEGEDPLQRFLAQLEKDGTASVDYAAIRPEVRERLAAALNDDGTLTFAGRGDLQELRRSPSLSSDEQNLIEMVLYADTRATDPALYMNKPLYQRAIVIAAGPAASLLFGFVLFCLMGMTVGMPDPDAKPTTQVADVRPGGVAKEAGIRIGDFVRAIDGVPLPDGETMVKTIHASAGKPITLTIERSGRTFEVRVVPKPTEMTGADGVRKTIGLIGITPNFEMRRVGPLESIRDGAYMSYYSLRALVMVLRRGEVRDSVGGPIAMGQMATAMQRLGLAHLVNMAAMFSLSLGIMNLLPIPILDGGHLLLLAVEKVRRRRLSPREIYRAQLVGLSLLAMLIVFVMYNDIARTLDGRAPH
jgi:regulator of sigma E protease